VAVFWIWRNYKTQNWPDCCFELCGTVMRCVLSIFEYETKQNKIDQPIWFWSTKTKQNFKKNWFWSTKTKLNQDFFYFVWPKLTKTKQNQPIQKQDWCFSSIFTLPSPGLVQIKEFPKYIQYKFEVKVTTMNIYHMYNTQQILIKFNKSNLIKI